MNCVSFWIVLKDSNLVTLRNLVRIWILEFIHIHVHDYCMQFRIRFHNPDTKKALKPLSHKCTVLSFSREKWPEPSWMHSHSLLIPSSAKTHVPGQKYWYTMSVEIDSFFSVGLKNLKLGRVWKSSKAKAYSKKILSLEFKREIPGRQAVTLSTYPEEGDGREKP